MSKHTMDTKFPKVSTANADCGRTNQVGSPALQSHLAQVAVGACHNKKRFPAGNLSLFDPNFSAVVIQNKNRVVEEVQVQHGIGAIGQNEVQARRAVAHPRFDITAHRHLLHLQPPTDIGLRQFHRLARSIRQQGCVHFVVAAARVQENAHLLAPDTPYEKDTLRERAVPTLTRLPAQHSSTLPQRVAQRQAAVRCIKAERLRTQ